MGEDDVMDRAGLAAHLERTAEAYRKPDYELVPVASEILYDLLGKRPRPVVLAGFVRLPDDSMELTLQHPAVTEEMVERAARILQAEVEARNEWYGLDNWTFGELAKFVLHHALDPETNAPGRTQT